MMVLLEPIVCMALASRVLWPEPIELECPRTSVEVHLSLIQAERQQQAQQQEDQQGQQSPPNQQIQLPLQPTCTTVLEQDASCPNGQRYVLICTQGGQQTMTPRKCQ